MPRLTRTQKYADLRDQLSSDSEKSVLNSQLAQFENKVNEMQRQAESFRPVDNSQVDIGTRTPLFEDLKKIEIPAFEPVQQVQQPQVTVDDEDSFENIIANIKEETAKLEETSSHTFSFEDKDFAEFVEQPIQKPLFEQPVEKPLFEQPVEEPVVQPVQEEEKPLIDESFFEDFKIEEPQTNVLQNTIAEVNQYNQNDGVANIEQITNQMVEDIRHPQEEQSVDTLEKDEEFSNTVSMEITKIMDQLSNTNTNPVIQPETNNQEDESDFMKSYFNVDDSLFKEDNNDGIEIKNIDEIEPATSEISDTIPFMINTPEAQEEYEEDDEDYDEDEGSNIVLNVILIVLIVILLAVLGLIVFYILKTKGIIG